MGSGGGVESALESTESSKGSTNSLWMRECDGLDDVVSDSLEASWSRLNRSRVVVWCVGGWVRVCWGRGWILMSLSWSHRVTQRGCPYEHGELGDAGRSGGSLVRDGSGDGIWSMASVSSVLGCFRGGDIPVGI